MMTRQPEQQQQSMLSLTHHCPTCKQAMKVVGRESVGGHACDLLTFQCQCGQVVAIMMQ